MSDPWRSRRGEVEGEGRRRDVDRNNATVGHWERAEGDCDCKMVQKLNEWDRRQSFRVSFGLSLGPWGVELEFRGVIVLGEGLEGLLAVVPGIGQVAGGRFRRRKGGRGSKCRPAPVVTMLVLVGAGLSGQSGLLWGALEGGRLGCRKRGSWKEEAKSGLVWSGLTQCVARPRSSLGDDG